jgi:fructokinase
MSKKFKIGIDYGGTKVEGILLDNSGQEIERKRFKNDKDYHSSIKNISNLINSFVSKIESEFTIGVGIPGFLSNETGLVKNANSIWLNNKYFKKDLESALNKEIRIMNDANCFTLSESIDGAGKKYNSVFGIIIGTGFGSGLSFNKQIIEGVNQVAGDWGHQPLPYPTDEEAKTDINCPVINCGRKLCSEQFISGPGFEKNFNKKYNTKYTSRQIVELDIDGDQRANQELSLYEDRLSRLISVMIGIFDPEAIILGGGMSNIERLYKNIPTIIPKYTFSDKIRNKILKNKHGDSSGVRGAAWLWDN